MSTAEPSPTSHEILKEKRNKAKTEFEKYFKNFLKLNIIIPPPHPLILSGEDKILKFTRNKNEQTIEMIIGRN